MSFFDQRLGVDVTVSHFLCCFFVSVLVVLEEVQEDGWGVPSLELLTNTHTRAVDRQSQPADKLWYPLYLLPESFVSVSSTCFLM